METESNRMESTQQNTNLRKGAFVTLIILWLYIVGQLGSIWQTIYVLVSPIIPETTIWEINKQFVFAALISAVVSVVALVLFFLEKYVFVIILIVLTLIGNSFFRLGH